MDNSLKGLILAAGIIITCVIVGLGFYISRTASDTAAKGAEHINSLNAEFAESDKTIYDGTQVSGSEVLNVIRKYKEEGLGIYVATKKGSGFFNAAFSSTGSGSVAGSKPCTLSDAQNKAGNVYINPIGRFRGTVSRDENGVIVGIYFTQE